MSKKHENPYVRGNYKALFAFWQEKQIVTRKEFETFAVNDLKMTETGAKASVGVILSPTESSERGDCQGNLSARGGNEYFGERLKKAGEDTRYRLRWRKEVLEAHKRVVKAKDEKPKSKKVKKTAKVAKTVKAKSKKVKAVKTPKVDVPPQEAPTAPTVPAVETPAQSEIVPA